MAETVSGEELLRMGYLDDLATTDELDPHVKRWAARLTSNAPLAVQGMKLALDKIAQGKVDTDIQHQRQVKCSASDVLRSGLVAFQKRGESDFQSR